ncbi:MAG: TlyA family RNA methyltransferase [Candidatus Aminicenantes bacterium]|nr:TlyA family RNA methyltransferase [Candidatus Aminicenantes bacterium]
MRADLLLIERGLAPTREKAKALILAGKVKADGIRIIKPSDLLPLSIDITIDQPMPFVSRGGLKLAAALDAFGLNCQDKICLDIGCSTGGFTDCLLKRGAKKVYAVDVNINQLDFNLRSDPRVIPLEKNARYLTAEDIVETPDLITIDLSFISVLKVLPALFPILKEGDLIVLLKPQFEAGKGEVGKKGIIRSPEKHFKIISHVLEKAQEIGFQPEALFACPIKGQRGNQEFFVLWRKASSFRSRENLLAMVSEVIYGQKG